MDINKSVKITKENSIGRCYVEIIDNISSICYFNERKQVRSVSRNGECYD